MSVNAKTLLSDWIIGTFLLFIAVMIVVGFVSAIKLFWDIVMWIWS